MLVQPQSPSRSERKDRGCHRRRLASNATSTPPALLAAAKISAPMNRQQSFVGGDDVLTGRECSRDHVPGDRGTTDELDHDVDGGIGDD